MIEDIHVTLHQSDSSPPEGVDITDKTVVESIERMLGALGEIQCFATSSRGRRIFAHLISHRSPEEVRDTLVTSINLPVNAERKGKGKCHLCAA